MSARITDTTLEESHEFAIALIMLGVAISRDGDSARITEYVEPDMLIGKIARNAMKSIKQRNRDGIVEFMASVGVEMVEGETAVGALIRSFIDIQDSRVRHHQLMLDKLRQSERSLLEKQTKNAGKPTKKETAKSNE